MDNQVKFYSVQTRENIFVPKEQVKMMVMKNGRKAAQAEVEKDGKTLKLFKILGEADKKILGVTD